MTTTPYVLEDKQLFVELLNVLNHTLRTQVAYLKLFYRSLISIPKGVDSQKYVMRFVQNLVTGSHKPTDAGDLIPGSCMIYAILEV